MAEGLALARNPDLLPFAHSIMGGVDLTAQVPVGTQEVSLEMELLRFLPPWLAVAIHKGLLAGVATFSMYVLVRRTTGVERAIALGLGAVYSLSHTFITVVTLHNGLGYAFVPLAVYVVVVRIDKAHYFRWVAVLAVIHAASSTVTHSYMAVGFAVIVGAWLLGVRRWGRLVVAMAIMTVLCVLNWSEFIYAASQYVPDSARVLMRGSEGAPDVLWKMIWNTFLTKFGILGLPALVLSLSLGFALRVPWRWRAVGAFCVLVAIGSLLRTVPWDHLGLRPVGAIQWTYINYAFPVVLLLFIAHVIAQGSARMVGGRWRRGWFALVMATAAFLLADMKSFIWVTFLGQGGIAPVTRIDNLANRPWAALEPFRVVSVPYRFVPGWVWAYGLESNDGYMNLVPVERAWFWRAVTRARQMDEPGKMRLIDNRHYILDHETIDLRGAVSIDVEPWLDLDLLGVANTRYIVSFVPLHAPGLVKVSGPSDWNMSRRSKPFLTKIREDVSGIFEPGDAFVYQLPRFLPRAYFAIGMEEVVDELSPDAFYEQLSTSAYQRKVLVRHKDAGVLSGAFPPAKVISVQEIRGGLSLQVEALEGGVLVLNNQYIKYWQATADGRPLTVVPVNGVHMALRLPAGTHDVEMRYVRPTLIDGLKAKL